MQSWADREAPVSRPHLVDTDGSGRPELPELRQAVEQALAVLEGLFEPEWGYCAPNRAVYPWQWLWDSCFHALVWAACGDARALSETRALFANQDTDGFLPHMGYQRDPGAAVSLWGRRGTSTITQPPMYGHTIRVLAEAGWEVADLMEPAEKAMRFLAESRRGPGGLVVIAHPWESGADDNPRWGKWSGDPFDRAAWMAKKIELLGALEYSPDGGAVGNARFSVAAASFNALVSYNAAELAAAGGAEWLAAFADELAEAIDALLWDDQASTWADLDCQEGTRCTVPVADALLPVLVTRSHDHAREALAALVDPGRFASPFGPCSLARREPDFDPTGYGRGSVWPHLTYLFALGALRSGDGDAYASIREAALRAMVCGDFSEHVDPLTGRGLGARPQGWSTLPVALEASPTVASFR